jgi:hypothetical protein
MNTLPYLIVSNGPFPYKKAFFETKQAGLLCESKREKPCSVPRKLTFNMYDQVQKISVNHSIRLTSKLMEHATLGSDYIETYD